MYLPNYFRKALKKQIFKKLKQINHIVGKMNYFWEIINGQTIFRNEIHVYIYKSNCHI